MKWVMLAMAVGCSMLGGCAVCASPYDGDYNAFGGRWERDMPDHGRVASAFTEAGYRIADEDVMDEENHDPAVDAVEGEDMERSIQSIGYETQLESDNSFEESSSPEAEGMSEEPSDALPESLPAEEAPLPDPVI